LSVDFDLNKGKVVDIHEARPFRPEVVDREADVVKPKLPGGSFREHEVTNNLDGIDFDDEPFESRMIRHLRAQIPDRVRILKDGNGKIDSDFDRAVLGEEVVPIANRLVDHELGQSAELWVAIFR
jgi:hypothetical protein